MATYDDVDWGRAPRDRDHEVLHAVEPHICPNPDWYIVFGSGFLQRMGDAQGIPAMATEFERRYRDTHVELRRWSDDWNDLAEWIFRRCTSPENVKLLCIIYSWGGGFGFKRFARHCRDRGISISGAVLSDAVAHLGGRWCHNLGISQAAAFWPPRIVGCNKLPRLKLYLPDNINKAETYWYIQQNGRLRGHELHWEDTGELAANRTLIKFRSHQYMDEAPEFRLKALEVADRLFIPAA